jgi:hypothetical protein
MVAYLYAAKAKRDLHERLDRHPQNAVRIGGRHPDLRDRKMTNLHRIGCLEDIIKDPATAWMTRVHRLHATSVSIDQAHPLTTTQGSHDTNNRNKLLSI